MRKGISKLGICTVLVCFTATGVISVAAQNVPPPKPPKTDVKPKPDKKNYPEAPPEKPSQYYGRGTTEKALAVDPNVNIQLPCVTDARVTVNGWQRDEIRVFVRNGTTVSFKVHEKDPKSGKPVWVVVGKQAAGTAADSDCLSGERIDIEVPAKASLQISGRETEMRVDSIRKVEIKNLGGNVALRHVSGGIYAETFEGDVTVENSSGQISLKTSTGNILAFEVSPGQVGDLFRAGTSNGSITLQKVDHRQIEAKSITGSVLFNGKFLPGGIYGFKTQNGAIKLVIPSESSCKVSAWYGFGAIKSEIPMKIETENITEGGKSLKAKMGDGLATVNLSGRKIDIVKRQ